MVGLGGHLGVVAGGNVEPALKLKTSSAKLAYDKQYNLKEAGWERPSHIKWDPSTKQVLRRAKQAAKENRGGTIDLTPQGNTHRVVYGKASDAVINRVAPSRPVLDLDRVEVAGDARRDLVLVALDRQAPRAAAGEQRDLPKVVDLLVVDVHVLAVAAHVQLAEPLDDLDLVRLAVDRDEVLHWAPPVLAPTCGG